MIERAIMILCVLLMCSCTAQHANERLVLGGAYKTASFDDGSSILELDQIERSRAHWSVMIVVAPIDGTITGQTLRTPKYLKPMDPPRLYGRYPELGDALHEQRRGALLEWIWALDEYGRSFGEVLLMPYRAVVYAMTEPRTWSPERAWERRPAHDEWSSGQPRAMQGASDDDADE